MSDAESPVKEEVKVVVTEEKVVPKQKAKAPVIPKREEVKETKEAAKEEKKSKAKKPKAKKEQNDASKPVKKEMPSGSGKYPPSFVNLTDRALNAIKEVEKDRAAGKMKKGTADI